MIIAIILFLNLSPGAMAHECLSVELESKYTKTMKQSELCFLLNKTFYLSRNCLDLSCPFIGELKKLKIPHSEKDRPGTVMCRALSGAIDLVKIKGSPENLPQCVFNDEGKSSISLNLLESWNGKNFSGPAKSINFEEAK